MSDSLTWLTSISGHTFIFLKMQGSAVDRSWTGIGCTIHPPLGELRAVLVAAEREMLRWATEKESRPATKGAGH